MIILMCGLDVAIFTASDMLLYLHLREKKQESTYHPVFICLFVSLTTLTPVAQPDADPQMSFRCAIMNVGKTAGSFPGMTNAEKIMIIR